MNSSPSAAARRRACRRRRLLAVSVVTAVVTTAGGVAYGAWSSAAAGTSGARSLTAVTATVDVVVGAADLYPGASGAVHFTVTNPNDYPVLFTAADLGAVVSDDETACPAANLTVTDKTGLAIAVAAGSTSADQFLPTAVTLSSTAGDGCQGRTFVVTTTLTGSSA